MFFVLNFEFYTEGDNPKMIILLIFIYGINNVLFIYFLSYLFKSVGKAQVFTFIFHYFTMLFIVLLSFVLRFFPETQKIQYNYLEFIFRIIPSYSFSFALFNMPFFRIYAAVFAWPDVPTAFEFHGCLWELIYLSATAVILFFLVFFIEFQHKLAFLYKKWKREKKKDDNYLNE